MTVISISTKVEFTTARKTLEVMVEAVSRHRCLEQILQGTARTYQQKGSLTYDLNQLASDVSVVAQSSDIEPLREPIAPATRHLPSLLKRAFGSNCCKIAIALIDKLVSEIACQTLDYLV